MPLPGRLEVRGLRCPGRHGVYPEERVAERVFLVDLILDADIGAAARSDNLADTLDFAALAGTVRGIVGGPSRNLLEALAVDVARAVLDRFPAVAAVTVRVAKPDPPGLDATAEAVSVTLPRDA